MAALLLFKSANQELENIFPFIDSANTRHLPVIWLNIVSDETSILTQSPKETSSEIARTAIDGEDECSRLVNNSHRQVTIDCHSHQESAFVHTRLEKYLLKEKVRSLLVGGVIDTGSLHLVKNTILQAANLGFNITLVLDVTTFPNGEHQNEIEQVIREAGGKVQVLKTILQELDTFGEGDSHVIYDFIPQSLRQEMGLTSQNILREVQWCVMRNRGIQVPRLIAIQGEIDPVTGAQPLYRHPADEQPALVPFTPIVNQLRLYLSDQLRQPFNHVLIQYYRHGKDNIGEHSDKTLDILKNTAIVNFSLGVTRIMHLKRKKLHSSQSDLAAAIDPQVAVNLENFASPSATTADAQPNVSTRKYEYQRVVMRDNSLFQLGWETNRRWLHAIRTDKRPSDQKFMDEVCHQDYDDDDDGNAMCEDNDSNELSNKNGFAGRISFTFRTIATFLSADGKTIFGQGAPATSEIAGASVTNSVEEEEEALRMLKAFSRENHDIDYDWEDLYGHGFSSLNFRIINH